MAKEQLVKTVDYTNVMYADITIIIAVLLISLFWKEQRLFILGAGFIYTLAALGYHNL